MNRRGRAASTWDLPFDGCERAAYALRESHASDRLAPGPSGGFFTRSSFRPRTCRFAGSSSSVAGRIWARAMVAPQARALRYTSQISRRACQACGLSHNRQGNSPPFSWNTVRPRWIGDGRRLAEFNPRFNDLGQGSDNYVCGRRQGTASGRVESRLTVSPHRPRSPMERHLGCPRVGRCEGERLLELAIFSTAWTIPPESPAVCAVSGRSRCTLTRGRAPARAGTAKIELAGFTQFG